MPGNAIAYALKQRMTLSRVLEDGALPLDDNRCERTIRSVVMGRSSRLFAGSVAAGERAARIMSLLETAKMNGLDPHAGLAGRKAGRAAVAAGFHLQGHRRLTEKLRCLH